MQSTTIVYIAHFPGQEKQERGGKTQEEGPKEDPQLSNPDEWDSRNKRILNAHTPGQGRQTQVLYVENPKTEIKGIRGTLRTARIEQA